MGAAEGRAGADGKGEDMIFLSLIVVLVLVQWWGSGGPIQWDGWFYRWTDALTERLSGWPAWTCVLLVVGIPVLVLTLVVGLLYYWQAYWWLLCINLPVLLYSLGRGRFTHTVQSYIEAAHIGDTVRAAHILDQQNLDPALRTQVREDNWQALHAEALRIFSYRGFERMFAVLFWFIVLGAPGALAYRLLSLYWCRLLERNQPYAARVTDWMTMVEWPAARLMGVTWALVGNFEYCMHQWREQWWRAKRTPVFLAAALQGALGAAGSQGPDSTIRPGQPLIEPGYSLGLVENILPMFSRALLAWVFVVALITLLR